MIITEENPHDNEHLDKMIEEFPEMYSGNGTIFRALYELKRLAYRDDVKSCEFKTIARDIEEELLHHLRYNLLDKTADIHFDLGEMQLSDYDDICAHKKKIHYPYSEFA